MPFTKEQLKDYWQANKEALNRKRREKRRLAKSRLATSQVSQIKVIQVEPLEVSHGKPENGKPKLETTIGFDTELNLTDETSWEDFSFELDFELNDFASDLNLLEEFDEPTFHNEEILQLKLQLNNKDNEIQELKEKISELESKIDFPIQNISKQENTNKNQGNIKTKQLLLSPEPIAKEEEPKIIQSEPAKSSLKQKNDNNLCYDNETKKQEFTKLLNTTWHPGKKDKYWPHPAPRNLKIEDCKKCNPQLYAVQHNDKKHS